MREKRRIKKEITVFIVVFYLVLFLFVGFSLKILIDVKIDKYCSELTENNKNIVYNYFSLLNEYMKLFFKVSDNEDFKFYEDILSFKSLVFKDEMEKKIKIDDYIVFVFNYKRENNDRIYVLIQKKEFEEFFYYKFKIKIKFNLNKENTKNWYPFLLNTGFKDYDVYIYRTGEEFKESLIYMALIFYLIIFIAGIFILKKVYSLITRRLVDAINEIRYGIENARFGETLFFDERPYYSEEIKQLISEINSYSHRIKELSEFKETIEEDATIEEVYSRIEVLLKDTFGINKFSIYRVISGKDKIEPVAISGRDAGTYWCSREIFIDSNLCRAKRTVKKIDSLNEFKNICPYFRGDENHHICFPVITGETVGLILQIVYSDEEKERLTKELPEIERYIKEVAPVLESKILLKSLKETTMRDPLTGIYNRRFLEEFSEQLIASAERNNYKYGILMIDIDHFKKVNDRYGHDVGDFLLREIVKVFHNIVRRSDLGFRYGGEEFLIVLNDIKTVDNAYKVAEKIRKAVEITRFKTGTLSIGGITVSIGVSVYPEHSDDFWIAIKYADIALYVAKKTGRNRSILFQPEMKEKYKDELDEK